MPYDAAEQKEMVVPEALCGALSERAKAKGPALREYLLSLIAIALGELRPLHLFGHNSH